MEFGGGEGFNFGFEFVSHSSYTDRDMEEKENDEMGVCSEDNDDSSSSVRCRIDSSDDDMEDERSCKDVVVLPVRKGISKFYSGKSKSFTSLADALSSASVKELAKPETLYSKKQNSLLARKTPDWNKFNSSRSNPGESVKKFAPSGEYCSSSASPTFCLPPLHPHRKKLLNPGSLISPPRQKCSPWRSLSISDLQSMVHNA